MKSVFHYLAEHIVTKTNFVLLLGLQNILSILPVFSSPLPIPPKTSIGMLTGLGALTIVFLFVLYKNHSITVRPKIQIIDFCVYGFVVANAVSLIGNLYIFDITNFRLLLFATAQYAALRLVVFSEKEIRQLVYMIGVTTVGVAFVSLLQLIFRDQAMLIAKNFLFGDAAYSIAADLQRGRGVQWGNLVITFPFFVNSAMLLQKNKSALARSYIWLGCFLLPLSFIVSNFRGLTLCFLIGLSGYLFFLFRSRLLPLKKIMPLVLTFVGAVTIGIFLASSVFQYNLLDRFFLTEKDRDVKSTFGRLFLYDQAISAFVSSPIVGIGAGNYLYDVDHIRVVSYYNIINGTTGVKENEKDPVASHNDILTILAETGILGFITYVGILFFSVKSVVIFLWKKQGDQMKRSLGVAFLITLVMLILSGLFENTPANNIVYLFFLFGASATWFGLKR